MKTPEKWREYFLELQKADVPRRISRREAALLLLVLSKMPEAKKACDTLMEKLRGKTWNWIEGEELLDSSLVILAIYNYHPKEIDGICLAHLTSKLLTNEIEVGGPYYDNGKKADVFTNFVILKLFRLLGSPLPNVEQFLESHDFSAPIEDDAAIIYELLLNVPYFSFSKKAVAGATQTMPFLVDALAYRKLLKRAQVETESTYQIVSEDVYKELQGMSSPLKDHAVVVWKMINEADTNHEITMLPKYFASSLLEHPKSLEQKLYVALGAANFYVWMAYTIYDDLIDEDGHTDLLPVANSMLRKALAIYAQFSRKYPLMLEEVFESFDKMDAANSWELAHCRYTVKDDEIEIGPLPAYSKYSLLADRARGHILGPMAIICKLQTTTLQRTDIKKALEHFLIAKQLSDDLHDWTTDFQKGHISTVVAYLLKSMEIIPGKHNIPELAKRMREYLWVDGIKEISKIILKHLAYSKRSFKKSNLLNLNGEFFLYIFDPLEESVRDNELKNVHQQQFLENFTSQ